MKTNKKIGKNVDFSLCIIKLFTRERSLLAILEPQSDLLYM